VSLKIEAEAVGEAEGGAEEGQVQQWRQMAWVRGKCKGMKTWPLHEPTV